MMLNLNRVLCVGDKLYGYCGGFFGRDSYGEKTVEAVGRDWVVVREDDGDPNFAEVASRQRSSWQDKDWPTDSDFKKWMDVSEKFEPWKDDES